MPDDCHRRGHEADGRGANVSQPKDHAGNGRDRPSADYQVLGTTRTLRGLIAHPRKTIGPHNFG